MHKYDPKQIEPKWQKYWEENKTFHVTDDKTKQKFYSLVEFPYPSGAGLHVGHPRPYTAMDVISRKKRMEGYNVLFPIGFDAFGLPTENYAIKTGRPPAEVTAENIATFTRQLKSLGYSFDWERVVDTTDPEYFRWTQWIFLQFYKAGLAYKTSQPINWCPKDKIGLANEEAAGGVCDRCGGPVEKRDKEQWMLAITKYAEQLLSGLQQVNYIPEAKAQQENWIGKSEGAEIIFKLNVPGQEAGKHSVTVFTTRPDTIFGATFLAVSPELAKKWLDLGWQGSSEVKKYIDTSLQERARAASSREEKEKTGVVSGVTALNPVTGQELPVWITNYVLGEVGTGAIMAVPAHDERDWEFATKYNVPVKVVIAGAKNGTSLTFDKKGVAHGDLNQSQIDIYSAKEMQLLVEKNGAQSLENGLMIESDFLNGLIASEAKERIIAWLEEKGVGKRKVNYKLRDWVFSRQRYWGEPIPLVKCERCADWIPVPEDQLPLKLPQVKKYEPTDTGESPLAAMTDWVNTTCPRCGGPATRETDTMPNWAGSSWYFLAYLMHTDKGYSWDRTKIDYWMPIDWYNGGNEHTVLHLLYSRFWNQFLYDQGHVPTLEPYKKRTSHGIILAEDGEKMSKSRGNVINPDEMVDRFGADALRTYIMFMGPFDQAVSWSTNGLVGVRRFLDRVWNLQEKLERNKEQGTRNSLTTILHQTIKKITADIEAMRFNTAIAALMELVNELTKQDAISPADYATLIQLLSPFAPHLAEELWQILGNADTVAFSSWPVFDPNLIVTNEIQLVVQINGKLRDTLTVAAEISEADAKQAALASEKIQKWLEGKEPKKIIYVKGKLVSIVV